MSQNRKRVVLSIEEKLELINKIGNGATRKQMSLHYGIGESTVRDILKQKDKLIQFAASSDNSSSMKKRKSMKSSTFEELDAALLRWVNQVRSEGTLVSGPIVAAKAKQFFEMLLLEGSFDASSGWLTRFKQRHGIREIGLYGEKLSCNEQAAEQFKYYLEQFLQSEGISYEQVYNADESGLLWQYLPTRTLAFENEIQDPEHTCSKERLTLLTCCNATGSHKLKLAVVGKSKELKYFQGMSGENLPVHYFYQKKGFMNQKIFIKWFEEIFIPQVREHLESQNLPQKAVLLIDNAPSHPGELQLKSQDGNIFAKFFPSKLKALIQPMNQGIIASIKKKYRTNMLTKRIEEGDDLKTFFKDYTILDSIYSVNSAWESVPKSTLLNSWQILTGVSIKSENEEEEVSVCDLANLAKSVAGGEYVNEENIIEWINCDANDPGYERVTDEQIVEEVLGRNLEESDEEDSRVQKKVSHKAALAHVEGLIQYLEQEDDSSLCDKIVLKNLKFQIKKKCIKKKKNIQF